MIWLQPSPISASIAWTSWATRSGGGVALQLAIRHQDHIRRLAPVSFPFRTSGWHPEIIEGQSRMGAASAAAMTGSPLHQTYCRLAPRPQDWPALHEKLQKLLTQNFDWTDDIRAIRSPTLLVAGDADFMPPSHIAEFYALLGGGQRDGGWDGSGMSSARLAILPGATHYAIAGMSLLAEIANAFFSPRER